MPHILVTNDDGYQAPALTILARALKRVGEVTVFAPDHNWSAAGHTKTMHKPLRIAKGTLADDIPLFVTTGTPSDCVALALLGKVEKPVDLVVSGINIGANIGHDVTYSGTVAGAMEGVVFGRPAIAASMDHVDGRTGDLEPAAEFVATLSEQVLEHGLPRYTLLNVNFPALPRSEMTGVRITRLGIRLYHDVLIERLDPKGQPYYWIGGEPPTGEPEEGTDVGALACGSISITPLNLDMTDRSQLARLSQWPLQWGLQS
ncbi:MAG: 5'/3'-nucleotidase SurE [Nitrososphaerales archaeon]